MNCEKCKNKKATVFYADDGGGQHALCAPCADLLGKLTHHSRASAAEPTGNTPFLPESSLFALSANTAGAFPMCVSGTDEGDLKCPFCSTSLSLVQSSGRVGCPECYGIFEEQLFPSTLSAEQAVGARMPARRRSSIDRKRNIANLKLKIKLAVEAEDYELAASIRDEIKKLEIHI